MGKITGERSVEIDAPIQKVFDIAADIEGSVDWMGAMKDVDVLERDGDGRAKIVETVNDAKVKTVKTKLSFTYNAPTEIRWRQEKGDVKALDGWWTLEDLGGDRTRATYALEVDPGRMLGMLIRGPVEGQVRDFLLGDAADGLKKTAEG
ncbi:MAG TPA: SRPBCC family protein [Baekduia sp.]|uniref:type II toxin-antitoxin system RatA family toxin n=1 Tax=Baekduia sp. TaxID=2600305 RepID=UPI002D79CA42|nr:SRPBCC family protein [Baekduia sp.]HET6507256.1 SRPBCC family protein [Baekduia sp.]